MGLFEFIILLVVLSGGGKLLSEIVRHRQEQRREQRKLEHEIKIAQIHAGLMPIEGLSPRQIDQMRHELDQLRTERTSLQSRIEHLETIVTSSSLELNLRLNRLLADVSSAAPAAASRSNHEATLSVERAALAAAGKRSRIGELFAERYELLAELGHGGMGVVYQAQDTKLGQLVTLKVLSPFIARDARALERFRHEASATRRINHPSVIRIYDLGEAGGEPYISMEYFPGVDLKKRVRGEGPLPQPECARILAAVAEGIRAAHEQGVIHRDLKPQNILVGAGGQIKIIDFGLAKSALLGGGLTVSGFILGTPQYMSPEQLQGREIDLRSDIYSLGIIAYEIRCGRAPFATDGGPIEITFKTLQEPHQPLRQRAPDTSALYEQIVDRCLEKDPDARYQSIDELLDELRRLP